MKMKDENERLSSTLLHLPLTHNLYYKYRNGRSGLSANDQIFLINGMVVPYEFQPTSLRGTRTKRARPRVRLTEEHARMLALPIIDERSKDVTKVVFPNGRVNHVLLARKNSNCPRLRSLHECMTQRRDELNSVLFTLEKKRTLTDELGGGKYIASGYGNLGRNVHHSIRPPDQPSLRKCLKFQEHHDLAEIIGEIFSHVAKCIEAHCADIYKENQRLAETNPNLMWPPARYQTLDQKWMSTQFIVRRCGTCLEGTRMPLKQAQVSAHTDTGDLNCHMFHCYISGGGNEGKGGTVAGTDAAIFEHSQGGAGYRVKTCMEDTLVVVILKSNPQLHGCIESSRSSTEDCTAWSARIIPFIPKGVWNWMRRHEHTELPFTSIP